MYCKGQHLRYSTGFSGRRANLKKKRATWKANTRSLSTHQTPKLLIWRRQVGAVQWSNIQRMQVWSILTWNARGWSRNYLRCQAVTTLKRWLLLFSKKYNQQNRDHLKSISHSWLKLLMDLSLKLAVYHIQLSSIIIEMINLSSQRTIQLIVIIMKERVLLEIVLVR